MLAGAARSEQNLRRRGGNVFNERETRGQGGVVAEQLGFFRCRVRAGEYVRPMSAATVAAVSAAVRNVLTGKR